MSPDRPDISREMSAWVGDFDISREMLARLKTYVGMLEDWNARHNLVSAASLADVWRRHVWDSAQLVRYVPQTAKTLADLGSGAGFPGLILAELLRGRVEVTLFEATTKKCRFLEAVRDRLGLDVKIRNERMEAAAPEPFDVITARACAPLEALLGYAQNFARPGSVCLFLKGQNLAVELTQARKSWKIKALEHPSLSDPSGMVLEIQEFRHVADRGREDRPPARPGRRQPEGRRR
ncbi:MAG TPA: 16S rRNA (guanine(527)-N(7))-methyltransferase RsmG [Rhizomicrobium sp.]|nr:16S rRNA (guanine(527)-N(7))-methyltransferase RsmG [Rhizomicrobium sp.]